MNRFNSNEDISGDEIIIEQTCDNCDEGCKDGRFRGTCPFIEDGKYVEDCLKVKKALEDADIR